MTGFLLEVGTEELPACFLGDAILQWRSRIPQSLENNSLTSASILKRKKNDDDS
ncbi:hypothetical protein VB620_00980 [Nodularia harveyana UHCC-0300]|uniref:Glycyl-tRNA synthetase beta subunit n=1 Tax=Nodularia harveyana UHCC-0300 TaxID=2974287 RepID=A0ABU5U8P6_9CYAN|nr:hypothetical protein [Nodularia harveyana]MEA5579911.1 hypothetical protein [Nodularia harveyana UHCC-0300]